MSRFVNQRPEGNRCPLIGDYQLLSLSCPAHTISSHVPTGSDFLTVQLFSRRFNLCVSGAATVAVSDETEWEKHLPPGTYFLQEYGGQGLFCGDNGTRELQYFASRLRSALSSKALKARHDRLADATKYILSENLAFGYCSELEATKFFSEATLYLLLVQTFGLEFEVARATAKQLIPGIEALLSDVSARVFLTRIPLIGDPLAQLYKSANRKKIAPLEEFIDAQVAELSVKSPKELSLIAQYYLFGDDLQLDKSVDIDSKKMQLLTLLVAGFETTGNAIAFTLRDLLTFPHCMNWLAADLPPEFDMARNLIPSYAATKAQRRIAACFLESLRLHPTAPAYHRKKRDEVESSNFDVPDQVTVLLEPVLKDRAVWGSDADTYNPERFMSSNTPPSYKVFGTGRRACTGRHLAIYESQLMLGFLLSNFEIEARSNLEGVRERLTAAPEAYWVRFKPKM